MNNLCIKKVKEIPVSGRIRKANLSLLERVMLYPKGSILRIGSKSKRATSLYNLLKAQSKRARVELEMAIRGKALYVSHK